MSPGSDPAEQMLFVEVSTVYRIWYPGATPEDAYAAASEHLDLAEEVGHGTAVEGDYRVFHPSVIPPYWRNQ